MFSKNEHYQMSSHHCRTLALDRKLDTEARGDHIRRRSLTPRKDHQPGIGEDDRLGERSQLRTENKDRRVRRG